MVLASQFAPIRGIWAGFCASAGCAHRGASTSVRYQSILWAAWSSASSLSKMRCQMPAFCHCRRRRWQVCPKGKSPVAGSHRHGTPVRSTKRIPVRTRRGSLGFRPANCTCRCSFGFGIQGSRRFQRSSGKMGLGMRRPPFVVFLKHQLTPCQTTRETLNLVSGS